MAKYLNVDFNDASLFEFSSTKTDDDFKDHTSSTGKKSFRKTYPKGITGELLNVSIRNSKIGDQLQMALKDEDGEIYVINFNLFDQSGNINQNFVESIIRYVGNLQKGTVYKVYPYQLKAEDQRSFDESTDGREVREKYYDKFAVSIKLEDGSKVEPFLQYKGTGDYIIPEIVWRDHPTKQGKKKPSAASMEAKTDFLISKLKEATEGHLKYSSNGTSKPEPKKESNEKPKEGQVESKVDDDYDDLPF